MVATLAGRGGGTDGTEVVMNNVLFTLKEKIRTACGNVG